METFELLEQRVLALLDEVIRLRAENTRFKEEANLALGAETRIFQEYKVLEESHANLQREFALAKENQSQALDAATTKVDTLIRKIEALLASES